MRNKKIEKVATACAEIMASELSESESKISDYFAVCALLSGSVLFAIRKSGEKYVPSAKDLERLIFHVRGQFIDAVDAYLEYMEDNDIPSEFKKYL